jgi:hypothetical protein
LLKDVRQVGVLADTLDAKWGNADSAVTISNVTIQMSSGGVGVLAMQESPTPTNSAFAEVIGDSSIRGGAFGAQALGAKAALSIVGTRQLISGNDVGICVNAGRALIEGNILSSNRAAAIQIENSAVVDAGDCSGENVSRLGTGSGPNGASAGLNDFSSYGCDNKTPWAITNSSDIPVVADRNFFEIRPGEDIKAAFYGPVRFSVAGNLSVRPPPSLQVECLNQIPPAACTLQEFLAAGGVITAGAPNAITSQDTVFTNRPGEYVMTRSYTFSGGCEQAASCFQTIVARDDQAPTLICSSGIVQVVDPGCDYATVTFTNLAADSCGELLGPWVPVSTARFPIGTNTVIVVATDLAYNSTACSFDIAVLRSSGNTQQPPDGKSVALRIVEIEGPIVTLELDGSSPEQFAVLTSTNLSDWIGLRTNSPPFKLLHTNLPSSPNRFYRALHLP